MSVSVLEVLAFFCSILGISLSILSYIYSRRNAAEQASRKCHEELLAEERRTEKLSRQLQELRLKYGESDE